MGDWQVGDLALCVNDSPNPRLGKRPLRRGAQYVVTGTTQPHPHFLRGEDIGLHLCGVVSSASTGAFASARFIKITPPEADAFDREVIEQMTGNPAKVKP